MSIVLLHGGGLSKHQLDGLALTPKPLHVALTRWIFGAFRRHDGKG